jgi:class 3 adenylate cyclase
LIDRIGDPLAWSAADKCLFVAVTFLTFTLWYWASWYYMLRHPEVAPYLDHAFLPFALRVQTATILAWTLVIAAALAVRRRRPEYRALVVVTLAFCGYEIVYGSYFFGLYTSLFSGLAIVASWAVGLIIFDKRAVVTTFIIVGLCLVGVAVAEQTHLLLYAPLFREAPFQNGVLHPSFFVSMGGVTLLMMLFIVMIIYFMIERWHDRERKLAVISEQLVRANEVISRYVASQLAEQVRAGNYPTLDRHERRRLTLFFSDIEDFAATADVMEPEDLSALLNEYLSEMTAIAERHGATIDKFVGDAIMIFFGAPAATTDSDHALRAVRMAVEMQERLVALHVKWNSEGIERPFHVRMGINTGQASIGTFGSGARLEYTAIGRHVNLAARLQAQCEPDRILVSYATWVHIHEQVPCTAKGEIMLKGFHQPVKVYQVDRGAALADRSASGL